MTTCDDTVTTSAAPATTGRRLGPATTGRRLRSAPSVDPTAVVVDCRLGAWTEVGPRTDVRESVLGDYSYICNDGEVIYAEIGRFVSIAAHVRINPGNHPLDRVSNAQLYPIRQLELYKEKVKVESDAALDAKEKEAKLAEIDRKLAVIKTLSENQGAIVATN